ncbi:MAG TPA: peptidoglycan recognition family protein [Streptosporangiaceae bacterium]
MTGRLSVDASGRLRGAASISYNDPWPCPNGDFGGMQVPQGILGVVMHTMVGNLPGTIAIFNDAHREASAHFGIDQNGHIHQFGPVNGWKAFAQVAGNASFYSIEHADNANPDTPLTNAQLTASAQIVEALATHGRFPLQESNKTSEEGFGTHFMGGAGWGGHTCPDLPPRSVRSNQRPEILRRAMAIRNGPGGQPSSGPVITDGTLALATLAARHGTHPATMLRATAEATASGEYAPPLATYINTVFAADTVDMPDGIVLHYQEEGADGVWRNFSWQTGPSQHPQAPEPLSALAARLGTDSESIVRLTAEKNDKRLFTGPEYDYINGVFTRSQVLVPAGLALHVN